MRVLFYISLIITDNLSFIDFVLFSLICCYKLFLIIHFIDIIVVDNCIICTFDNRTELTLYAIIFANLL